MIYFDRPSNVLFNDIIDESKSLIESIDSAWAVYCDLSTNSSEKADTLFDDQNSKKIFTDAYLMSLNALKHRIRRKCGVAHE